MKPHAMADEDKPRQPSPFAKLFSSNEQTDKQLQKIRDRIYHFAWSRHRRDEAKLDWVLSENGVNRNVPLRLKGEFPSASNRDRIDALSCWLLLTNKRISADFTRFIYSVNDLDILVDLKASDTELNQAKLDKIVNLLQNSNFQRYTRSARVRIHFPDKYPFQDLPVFNQYALENISLALDSFRELTYLSVRVVPMQGPEVYELRLAAFPFYPMSMTNWSIRMLNSRSCNWDLVGGEKLHHLNLAWELFQETGSLTATVHAPDDAEKPTANINPSPRAKGAADVPKNLDVGQKKNGSQKRKGRKLRALSIADAPNATRTTSDVPSADLPLRPSSPPLDPPKSACPVHDSGSAAVPSRTKSSAAKLPDRSAEEPAKAASLAGEAAETAHQSSSVAPSSKLETTSVVKQNPISELSDEAVRSKHPAEQQPYPVSSIETAQEESVKQQRPQEASPSSSAPSSVTLGRDQSDGEIETHSAFEESPQVETTVKQAAADGEKPARKKRKNRKKGKKTQSTDTSDIQSNNDFGQQIPIELEGGGRAVLITTEKLVAEEGSFEGIFAHGQRPFPLSEIVELGPWDINEQYLVYKKANGNHGVLSRSSDLDRLSRQLERKAAQDQERLAEKMRVKEKRKNKKAKEVMLRRKEPSDGLRRRFDDTKQLASSKQESDLKKRINEIVGDSLRNVGSGFQVSSPEDTDFSDSSPEDTPPSPEPARGSPVRHEYPGMSSVSCRRERSGSSQASTSEFPRPMHVFEASFNGEKDSKTEPWNRQIHGQRLVEEVEDSDDAVSVVSQYGDEGLPSISDDASEGPAA